MDISDCKSLSLDIKWSAGYFLSAFSVLQDILIKKQKTAGEVHGEKGSLENQNRVQDIQRILKDSRKTPLTI